METVDTNYDSDDLPDLFELSSSQPSEIKEGDIVWAKYRQNYWPSLIRKIYKKDKKASLWYLDTPRKCFKVNFKNIHSFKDHAFSLNAQKEASNSPMKALHEKVFNWTLCYIQRKGQGFNDDPGDYFDRSKYYLSLYDLKNGPQSSKSNELANQSTVSCLRDSLNDGYSASSDEESVPESDEEDLKVTKFLEEIEVTDEDDCPVDKANAIVDCITAGKVDKYLLGILSSKIPSQRQLVYNEYVKKNDLKLLNEITPSVTFKDREHFLAIYNHIQNYYESIVEKGSRYQFNYIMYVWIPDALDKAVEFIENKSKEANVHENSAAKRQLFAGEDGEKYDSKEDINSFLKLEENSHSPKTELIQISNSMPASDSLKNIFAESPNHENSALKRQLLAGEDDEKNDSKEDMISFLNLEKNSCSPKKKMRSPKKIIKSPKTELIQISNPMPASDSLKNIISESPNPMDVDLPCPNVKNSTKLKPGRGRKGCGKKKMSIKVAENIPHSENLSCNSAEGIICSIKIQVPARKKAKLPRKVPIVEPSSRVMRSHRTS